MPLGKPWTPKGLYEAVRHAAVRAGHGPGARGGAAVQKAKGGFHGLNLHYLHPALRAQFLDSLLDITNNDKFDRTTRMKMSYAFVKGQTKLRFFKPCFKHYLSSNIGSPLLLIEPADWEIAIFLPTESFRKVSKSSVWRESRKQL